MQRARSDVAKRQRATSILDATRACVDELELGDVSMDVVAGRVGLTKGALYRYVPTREALFLALTHAEYLEWFDAVDTALLASPRPTGVDDVADVLIGATVTRPRFLRLLAAAPTLFEPNTPFDEALAFKQAVLEHTVRTAGLVAEALHADDASCVRLLLQCQSVVVGLHHHAHPAPVVREVLASAGFELVRTDLAVEIGHAIRALTRAVPQEETT